MGPVKAVLVSLPMFFLSALLITGGSMTTDPLSLTGTIVSWLIFNGTFVATLVTGKTHKYRSALFILIAGALIIFFSTAILSTRGNLALTADNFLSGETPFCHLVIPMIIVPALLTGTVIFPGRLISGFASIAGMLLIWGAASLILGRGWCSWVCFYGGYDECFSRLSGKARIRNVDRRWTYLPWAVLLVIVLTSAVALEPIYCAWFCPFKAVTEFAAVTDVVTFIQTIIFVVLFVGLVIVLPFLTKKRVQCATFCPLGALQSLTNKLNVFDMRVDRSKCTDCNACVRQCSLYAIDEKSLAAGGTSLSCAKCGQCVDSCPKHAIDYHIKGTAVAVRPNLARVLFMYAAFLVTITIGGGMVASAIWRILRVITTGSML
jgi:polyferredoxin